MQSEEGESSVLCQENRWISVGVTEEWFDFMLGATASAISVLF